MTRDAFRESARTPGIDGKHRRFRTRSRQHLAVFSIFALGERLD
ncbi:hypothetical protein CSB93_0927 [Pseudomonas paraeruginosa]|uniref:Uncharacterized protein n=1 Tax=Pseudomonas paraeruginosa TaxID=2994495 RepID=A0A2R3J1G7_9PSED|nr:hypothetical protein CSB93_0927 [Pseudomonas paraeruginosa]AWE90361.1 hypothetical protein CSC28_6244 [Pseudomonas paraeruginosa]PTC33603.1 hypothetical protein CLJ1_5897 [Pseudomonas aeruginosa]